MLIEGNGGMKIITINIPEIDLKYIEFLLDGKNARWPSRSELIRTAVREFLNREIDRVEKIEETVDSWLKLNGLKIVRRME